MEERSNASTEMTSTSASEAQWIELRSTVEEYIDAGYVLHDVQVMAHTWSRPKRAVAWLIWRCPLLQTVGAVLECIGARSPYGRILALAEKAPSRDEHAT